MWLTAHALRLTPTRHAFPSYHMANLSDMADKYSQTTLLRKGKPDTLCCMNVIIYGHVSITDLLDIEKIVLLLVMP